MATKKYNIQYFSANVGGQEVEFKCYTTDTRNGFCHTAVCMYHDYTDTKISYWNRTWERFHYETVLSRAIDKFPKSMREELREQIIEKKYRKVHEECEAFLADFEKTYAELSDRNKEILRNGPEIQTEEQAQATLGIMKFMNLMDKVEG